MMNIKGIRGVFFSFKLQQSVHCVFKPSLANFVRVTSAVVPCITLELNLFNPA